MEITKTPQKVLLVITKSNWGGAQKYVHDIATTLHKQRVNVAVALGGNGELSIKLREAGVRVIELRKLKNNMNPFTSLISFFELIALYRKERPTVVHLNSSKVGLFGAVAASGKMAWVNNAQMDPRSRYPEGMKPTTEHFIAAPMMGRDRLFGVLVVARNSAPEFVEEEAQLIDLFAHAATVALENARLYSTLDSQQNNGKDSESFKALDKSIVM